MNDADRSELLHLHRLTEELERRRVREDLEAYCRWIAPDEPPARHHRFLLDKLAALERGEIRRLMVFMPPGSAKSTYASVRFASWYLGRHPKHDIVGGSHTADLADRFGRRVRNIVGSEGFRDVFGVGLSGDNAAAGRWATSEGGEYHAVGVGGSITGRRANGIIIDDPVPGREEADSETYRLKCWEWWKSDMRTRLKPNGWVVVIQTRWHPEDLSGMLLDDMRSGGEQWEVLSLPMLAEANDPLGRAEGEMLWGEWFTPEMVRIAQRDARGWSALFQQRPTPDTGDYFRRDWIRWYDSPPERLTVYGSSDYAVTHEGGDYTEHGIGGVDEGDNLYLLDWWYGRTAPDVWINEMFNLQRQWKTLQWNEEKGQIEKSVGPFIDKRMNEEKMFFFRQQYPSAHDKPTRAQAIRGRFAQGKVYLPRGKAWANRLVEQMMEFPVGKHDDGVDVLSLFGRMLDDMRRPVKPKEVPKPRWWQPKGGLVTIGEMIRYSDKYSTEGKNRRI